MRDGEVLTKREESLATPAEGSAVQHSTTRCTAVCEPGLAAGRMITSGTYDVDLGVADDSGYILRIMA
jgi:hypothetical protein